MGVLMIHCRRDAKEVQVLWGEGIPTFCAPTATWAHWIDHRGLCWSHLLRDFQARAER